MNNYFAYLHGTNGVCWGFEVSREKVKTFTANLAKEIIEFANKEYIKRFPEREEVEFNYIKLDMSDYEAETVITATGDETHRRIGNKKSGIYWADKNLLRIYINGTPIYENNNGTISRDSVAIMDSLQYGD